MAEAAGGPRSAGRNAKTNAAAAFARNSSKATQAAVAAMVGELGIPSAGRNAANSAYLKEFGHQYKLLKLAPVVDETEECKLLTREDQQLMKDVAALVLKDEEIDALVPGAEGGGRLRKSRRQRGRKGKKSRRVKKQRGGMRGGMRILDAVKGFFRGLCGGVRGVGVAGDEAVAGMIGDAEGQVNRNNLLRTVQGLGVTAAVLGGGGNYFIDFAKTVIEMILQNMPDITTMLTNALGVVQGSLELGGLGAHLIVRFLALYFIVKTVMIIQDYIKDAGISLMDLRKAEHRQALKLDLLRGLFKREPTADELAQLGDMDAALDTYLQERPPRPQAPMAIPPPLPRAGAAALRGAAPLSGNRRLAALRNAAPLPGNAGNAAAGAAAAAAAAPARGRRAGSAGAGARGAAAPALAFPAAAEVLNNAGAGNAGAGNAGAGNAGAGNAGAGAAPAPVLQNPRGRKRARQGSPPPPPPPPPAAAAPAPAAAAVAAVAGNQLGNPFAPGANVQPNAGGRRRLRKTRRSHRI